MPWIDLIAAFCPFFRYILAVFQDNNIIIRLGSLMKDIFIEEISIVRDPSV